MSGIRFHGGRNRATAKIWSALSSFMFEQECGELTAYSNTEKATLKSALAVLAKHIN